MIPPGYMVLSVACVNIRSSLWLLLNSTSTVPGRVRDLTGEREACGRWHLEVQGQDLWKD